MTQQLLELHNECSDSLTIWIEPWGEELRIGPGATWRLIDTHNPPSSVSVTYRHGGMSISTMPSAKIRVLEGSDVVWES